MSRRRTNKSAQWHRAHEKDPQVRAARQQGFRSRSALKLIELDSKLQLFFDGAKVTDLGSAPGGWSQVASSKNGAKGTVVAVDILPMSAIEGVNFICGDFTVAQTAAAVAESLNGKADIVLSDMSPNISGIAATDQARAADLAMAAVDFAVEYLEDNGKLLLKVFQGAELAEVREYTRQRFAESRLLHLYATKKASKEAYLFAMRPQIA
ncbi:MAG: SAM-dependent methyltransferase [Gammaproteobacteria bacterium WSBS_2016_MAG_OTU1]